MERRQILPLLVAAVLLTAGCASFGGTGDAGGGDGGDGGAADLSDVGGGDGGDGADGGSQPRDAGGGAGEAADERGGGDGSSGDGGQADVASRAFRVDRQIIRSGTVKLEVDDYEAARTDITDRARGLGGYVGGSGSTRHTRGNRSWTTGYVLVRVPSGEFPAMLSFVRDRGTVLDEQTETKDVTDRLVDLEARLKNLEERRARLRSFYERANGTQELLRIEEKLSEVQGRIESLKAQKRSLENRVAFATLRVRFREPEPEATPTPTPAENATGTSIASAFTGSMTTLLDLGYGLVLFVVRLMPWLVFVGIPSVAVLAGIRRRYGVAVPGWRSGTRGRDGTGGPPGEREPGETGGGTDASGADRVDVRGVESAAEPDRSESDGDAGE